MRYSKTLALSILSMIFQNGQGFTQPAFFTPAQGTLFSYHHGTSFSAGPISVSSSSPSSSTTSLQMMDLVVLPFTFSEITSSIDSTTITSTTAPMLLSTNQNFESRLLSDMAHLILDVVTLCSPDTVLLRLLIFLGRILSILSDYVPDHSMTYDELIFQLSMLIISTDMFFKKFSTTIKSWNEDTSFRDRRMYKQIFYPAGFTFDQYRSLLSLDVLEWTFCKPGQFMFQDDSSLFITYKGSIQQHPPAMSSSSSSSSYCACEGSICYEIIGNITQAYEILESRRKKSPSSSSSSSSLKEDIDTSPSSSSSSTTISTTITKQYTGQDLLRAGPKGATLLRINTKALLEKVGQDSDITESIKSLCFNAMQRKLSSYTDLSYTRMATTTATGDNNQLNKTLSHQFL